MTPEFLYPYIKRGSTVIDVGANIGTVTEMLSRLAGPDGRVIAVEPGIKAFAQLKSMVVGLEFEKDRAPILPLRLALGDNRERVRVVHHGDWTLLPCDHVLPVHYTDNALDYLKEKSDFVVEQTTLDALVSMFDVWPSFVKIDVDGWECAVTRGAENLIKSHRTNFVVEFGVYTTVKLQDDVFRAIAAFILRNYTAIDCASKVTYKDAMEIYRAIPSDGTIDVLFVPPKEK